MIDDDGLITVCELCRVAVDPDAANVVRAFPQEDLTTFGGPRETGDGIAVFFHERCFPSGNPMYRLDA